MNPQDRECPDCRDGVDRRGFLRSVGVTAAAPAAAPLLAIEGRGSPTVKSPAETAVKALYESLTDKQREGVLNKATGLYENKISFDWNHEAKGRGLLRTFVSNNWFITEPRIKSDFYTAKQQD